MALILIADDERMVRENLKALLTGEGHSIIVAKDGEEAMEKCGVCKPDLLLLDVMMPKLNGFKACERIRQLNRSMPIIFLTARDDEVDEIRGISLGADDYISKDAGESLLLARIDGALRRIAANQSPTELRQLMLDDIKVDFEQSLVVNAKGDSTVLTVTELELMRSLVRHSNQEPVSNETLSDELRAAGCACNPNVLYTHISRLRAKLGAKASRHLVNLQRQGYQLVM